MSLLPEKVSNEMEENGTCQKTSRVDQSGRLRIYRADTDSHRFFAVFRKTETGRFGTDTRFK